MTLPSNGITPDVIRDAMPPYDLSQDLLEGTFAALPPPPPDASAAWRQARATRLIAEIATLMPATAGQARMAAQILVLREVADTLASQVYAPGATMEQMCRAGRASAEVARSATALGRALERCQQKPAPFFGTVVAEGVDVAALAAAWGGRAVVSGEAAGVALASVGEAGPARRDGPEPAADQPNDAPGVAGDGPSAAVTPMPLAVDGTALEVRAQLDLSPDEAARHGRDAGATSGWVVTPLDQGPGWTREVVRRRTSGEAGIGAAPGAAAR